MEKKNVKISLWGGFHNVDSINVIIPASDYEALNEGSQSIADSLSPSQLTRVQRHFCGMSDCRCGGIYRDVKWELKG